MTYQKHKLYTIGYILGLIICLILAYYYTQERKLGADLKAIPSELQLKVDKEKIVDSKDEDWIVQKEDGSFENKGKIKSYDYISNIETKKEAIFDKGETYSNKFLIKKTDKYIDYGFMVGGDAFYKDIDGKVYEIQKGATTTIEAFDIQTKETVIEKISKLFIKKAIATDYYAGAYDGGTAQYDDTNSNDWSYVRNNANALYARTNNAYLADTSWKLGAAIRHEGSGYWEIGRSHLPIDSSGLPDDCNITAASLNAYAASVDDSWNDSYGYITIVSSTQASVTELVVGDYSRVSTTEAIDAAERKDLTTDVSLSAYTVFDFNSTGFAMISTSSWTKLAIREGHDNANSAPSTSSIYKNGVVFYSSRQTGTSQDPYLSVTCGSAAATTNETYIIDFNL